MTDYVKLGQSIGELLVKKQQAYGDSFSRAGEIMRVLYPNGVPLEKLDDALTIVRIIDKLFRIANMPTTGDVMGESPWVDIAGYSILSVARSKNRGKHNG